MNLSKMAQVAPETYPDPLIDNALLQHSSLSNKPGASSKPALNPNMLSKMATHSPSISPSRSKTSTTSESRPSRMSRSTHQVSSDDLQPRDSRDSSPDNYTLSSRRQHDILRIERNRDSRKEPRYCSQNEESDESSGADVDPIPQAETITTSFPEAAERLTPVSDTSSRASEDYNLEKLPVLSRPNSEERSALESPSCAPGMISVCDEEDPIVNIDSVQFPADLQGVSSDEDDYMDDEDCPSESENECLEERWISNDEGFEARVIRATGYDLNLASRLIPQVHRMLQDEKSPLIGSWEPEYRQCAGSSYGQGNGTPGAWAGGPSGQRTNSSKRQRGNNDHNGDGNSNNEDRERDGDGKIHENSIAEDVDPTPLACPFHKKKPSMYNALYKAPNGKAVYMTCGHTFKDYKSLREHLIKTHRFIQCEKCKKRFTGKPWKQRQIDFQAHLNLQECQRTLPEVSEGITEMQWAEIDFVPRRPRTTAANDKLHLTSDKWKYIWTVLFPSMDGEEPEEPPHPWYEANVPPVRERSTLEKEMPIFQRCYFSSAKEGLSNFEHTCLAFQLWFVKQEVGGLALQQDQSQNPDMTVEHRRGPEPIRLLREEDSSNWSNAFPNAFATQKTGEKRNFASHQQSLESFSREPAFQKNPDLTWRNSSAPAVGHQSSYHTDVPAGPYIPHGGLDAIQSSVFKPRIREQLSYGYPAPTSGDNGELQDLYSSPPSLPAAYQNGVPMDYSAPGHFTDHTINYSERNNEFTEFDIDQALQLSQNNSAPPPQMFHDPIVIPNQLAKGKGVVRTQTYGSASGTIYSQVPSPQSKQSQQALPVRKMNPHRSFPQAPPSVNEYEA